MTTQTLNKIDNKCENFRKALQEARTKAGLSMQDAYEISSIHKSNISAIETGGTKPGLNIVERLCEAYKTTIVKLLGGTGRCGAGPLRKLFAANVSRLMDQRRLTYRELAEKTGLDASYLMYLCRGDRSPSMVTIFKTADGLRVDASELFAPVKGAKR